MGTIPTTTMRAVVRELPDALRPQWLAETWSGTFGRSGLTAGVTRATSHVTVLRDGAWGGATAAGAVHLPGAVATPAAAVGGFDRGVTLGSDGMLAVQHANLTLNRAQQGSGFARGFNDHAIARYTDAGVDRITVSAGRSVGAYAWARQGFDTWGALSGTVEGRARAGAELTKWVDEARRFGRITDAQFDAVAPRLVRGSTLQPDALVSVQELAALDIGKPVLLNKTWNGMRPLTPSNPWWGTPSAPSGVRDAATGAAQLSQRVRAQLPPSLDAERVVAAAERQLRAARPGIAAARPTAPSLQPRTRIDVAEGDRVSAIAADATLTSALGEVRLGTRFDAATGRVVGTEQVREAPGATSLRSDLDALWRTLGVDEVTDLGAQQVRTVS